MLILGNSQEHLNLLLEFYTQFANQEYDHGLKRIDEHRKQIEFELKIFRSITVSTELISKIQELKNKVDELNAEMHTLQGEKSSILKRLEAEFEINTIEEAKQLIAQYQQEIEKTNLDISEIVGALEEKIAKVTQE